MRRLPAIAAAVVLLCLGLTQATSHAATPPTWQWQLTWPVNTSVAAPVFDIDYDGAGDGSPTEVASVVATLHGQGKQVICYLETGGWESYRPDAKKYPASVLGRAIDGWAGEKYVDVRQRSVLEPILTARFRQCQAAGFDGVETDIDDQYTASTGFPLTKVSYEQFNMWVAADIHSLGMRWFLKNGINGDSFITDLAPIADGTVNEQCYQYNECASLQPFLAAGKPVYNAEYTGTKNGVCPKAIPAGTNTVGKGLALGSSYRWWC